MSNTAFSEGNPEANNIISGGNLTRNVSLFGRIHL